MAADKRPRRKKVPTRTETSVLIDSARRCALCFHLDGDLREKPGQIAHLDRDRTNSAEDNLAWLCMPHHSQFDSKTSQHRNYTVTEVKTARRKLYAAIRKGLHQSAAQDDQDTHPASDELLPQQQPPSKQLRFTAKHLNQTLADQPHKCSFCGYSFSLLPELDEGLSYAVLAAVCPKCGNRDKVLKFYEG